MTGALVILAAVILVGAVLYLLHRRNPAEDETSEPSADGEVCCGQHAVCEKTSLQVLSPEIVYYDDEELDLYKGRAPETYTDEEEDEFRDVLLTLLPEDVPGWAKSLQLRGVSLPVAVRDELLLLVADLRANSGEADGREG